MPQRKPSHSANASSRQDFALAKLTMRGMLAWEEEIAALLVGDTAGTYASRDEGMADELTTLRSLLFPNDKMILWAHNYHIEKSDDQDQAFGITIDNMGERLRNAWGSDYVAIGLLSYQPDINWPYAQNVPRCQSLVPPAASNAAELMLHNLGASYLIVDLSAMASITDGSSVPFFAPEVLYQYDPANPGNGASTSKLPSQFNGLIYIDHSPAMDSIVWGA